MGAGTEDKASAWAEALERPTPGASKEGRTNAVPCAGAEHLLPASHCRLVSTCHRARSPPARPPWEALPPGRGRGTRRIQSALLPPSPGPRPTALSPRSTCCPWWWSTSAAWGCPVTSTTGSTSSWPCEHCPGAPSGGPRPSRGHRVRGGGGNQSDPGVRDAARRHRALPEDRLTPGGTPRGNDGRQSCALGQTGVVPSGLHPGAPAGGAPLDPGLGTLSWTLAPAG